MLKAPVCPSDDPSLVPKSRVQLALTLINVRHIGHVRRLSCTLSASAAGAPVQHRFDGGCKWQDAQSACCLSQPLLRAHPAADAPLQTIFAAIALTGTRPPFDGPAIAAPAQRHRHAAPPHLEQVPSAGLPAQTAGHFCLALTSCSLAMSEAISMCRLSDSSGNSRPLTDPTLLAPGLDPLPFIRTASVDPDCWGYINTCPTMPLNQRCQY